ncbi:hypothetical protein JTB14_030982 [Gonioctena quinquepunctata]|nr:hypothetical protein JTB14_030982 [Gonioctena quinquepunctata]
METAPEAQDESTAMLPKEKSIKAEQSSNDHLITEETEPKDESVQRTAEESFKEECTSSAEVNSAPDLTEASEDVKETEKNKEDN